MNIGNLIPEVLKEYIPVITAYANGHILWMYNKEEDVWIDNIRIDFDIDAKDHIIGDQHFEARKAHYLGKEIQYRNKVGGDWFPTSEPEWMDHNIYREIHQYSLIHYKEKEAFKQGKKIEYQTKAMENRGEWIMTLEPSWFTNYKYRVKPEPEIHYKEKEAFKQGKTIEYLSSSSRWRTISQPKWSEECVYRVKPEIHPQDKYKQDFKKAFDYCYGSSKLRGLELATLLDICNRKANIYAVKSNTLSFSTTLMNKIIDGKPPYKVATQVKVGDYIKDHIGQWQKVTSIRHSSDMASTTYYFCGGSYLNSWKTPEIWEPTKGEKVKVYHKRLDLIVIGKFHQITDDGLYDMEFTDDMLFDTIEPYQGD